MVKAKKQMYRIVLRYKQGLTRSVFIRATSRLEAEQKALKRYKTAIGVDHPLYPQS